MTEEVKPGRYLHYKGKFYEVIGVGKHSETLEEFVVYRHDGEIWVRPKEMFLEKVEVNREKVPRFKFIGN